MIKKSDIAGFALRFMKNVKKVTFTFPRRRNSILKYFIFRDRNYVSL